MSIKIQNFFNEVQDKLFLDKRFTVFNYSIQKNKNQLQINLKISDIRLKKVIKKLFNLYFTETSGKLDLKIEILPSKQFHSKPYAVAGSGFIPMYKNPSNTGEMINQILLGEICTLLDASEDNEWALIKMQTGGYLGWVNPRSLIPLSQKEIMNREKMPGIVVTEKKSEIHELPDIQSNSLRSAYLGIKMPSLSRHGMWLSVLLPDGLTGWISAEEAEFYKPVKPKNAKKILKTAKKFLGSSYLWGGRCSDGIDCSGLVQTAFNFNGYNLPRDSGLQIKEGIDVGSDFNNLLAGDLLFFGPNEKKTTHVGIFTGEGKTFIHSSGYVRFNSLDKDSNLFDERLYNLFKGARRIIR